MLQQDLLAGFKSEEFVSSANGNVDLRDDDQDVSLLATTCTEGAG